MQRTLVDMRALFGCMLSLSCLSLGTACGSSEEPGGTPPPSIATRVESTRGGPIVVTRDGRIAVATNRSGGVVTVFHLDPSKGAAGLISGKKEEVDLDDLPERSTDGRGSEPWAAVIGLDDDTAYVIARHDGRVVRIVDLHGHPKVDRFVKVGSEPTSIVIAPTGLRLFIANWGEGTISVVTVPSAVTTPDFKVSQIDLNEPLVQTGVLGNVEPRPGLAHPRALAMTDDGDDDPNDEVLYATEFFSQQLSGAAVQDPDAGTAPGANVAELDRNRQGIVYRIGIADGTKVPITLAPVADTGFVDSDKAKTGCFPNQLYAAAINGDRLYVTSLCASPRGPTGAVKQGDVNNTANFKTLLHPVLFAIDTATDKEVTGERRVLTREIEDLNGASADAVPRMPLIPTDLVFARPKANAPREAFITAMGADAVFRLGDPGKIGFIDTAAEGRIQGHLPIGTAVLEKASLALVLNDNSQSVSVVDLASNTVEAVPKTIDDNRHALETRRSPANEGHLRFATGAKEWSFKGQAWGSCEGCHPDGLSDGVTWFFSRGPRRTISTAGTYDDAGNRRVMLWTGNIDEVHDVEVIARTVTGGVGAVLWHYASPPAAEDRIVYDGADVPPGKPASTLRNNLNGSVKALLDDTGPACTPESLVCDRSPSREWDLIDAYIRTVRAPNRPTGLNPDQVKHGASLFRDGQCAGCHGGPSWTISKVFYPPGDADYTGALPPKAPAPNPDGSMSGLDIGRLRKETYTVPPALQALNPVSLPSGSATFRSWNLAGKTPQTYLYGTLANDGYDSKKTHGNDQINCVLRAVGTFPKQLPLTANSQGIVAPKAPPVLEVRAADMKTLALGATGFNIPSLLGLAASGSYFHAGNARTLEEAFDSTFAAHYQALKSDFLADSATRKDDLVDLVAYLLSIDDTQTPEPVPGSDVLGFDPDLCRMSDAPQGTTTASCENVQSDPKNCGACGHDCGGGTCTSGKCDPFALATGQSGPHNVVVDSAFAYWASGTAVMKAPLAGGIPITMAMGLTEPPCYVAVDATNLYWTTCEAGLVMKLPLTGIGVTADPIATGQTDTGSIAVDANNVYFTNRRDGTVMSVPIGGGSPVTLASSQGSLSGLALDATTVYWTGSSIASLPKSASTAPNILAAGAGGTALAISATTIGWVTGQAGSVMSVGKAGGATRTVAQVTDPAGSATQGVVIDADAAYFATSTGVIMRAALDGQSPPVMLATGQNNPVMCAMDAAYLYYAQVDPNDARIMKLAK